MLRTIARPARPVVSKALARANSTVAKDAVAGYKEAVAAATKAFPNKESSPRDAHGYEAQVYQELAHRRMSYYPSNAEAAREFYDNYAHTKEHAQGTGQLWKKISIFVFVPALILTGINTYYIEKEHAEHRAHKLAVPEDERPKDMEFQNIRVKDYFWGDGDKTLFWNPRANFHNKPE